MSALLAAPEGGGLKGLAKRLVHRAVLATFEPYLVRVQDCIAVTVRALDTVARRIDEQAVTELGAIVAMHSDLVDFAAQVEEELEE